MEIHEQSKINVIFGVSHIPIITSQPTIPMPKLLTLPMPQPDTELSIKKKFDGNMIAQQFIQYFYNTWSTNVSLFETDNVIKIYSKIKFNSVLYEGLAFIELLKLLRGDCLNFINCKCEIIDSGSRQIYILVTGQIQNTIAMSNFNQTFMIAYAGENSKKGPFKWTLMNSILIIN